MDPKNCKLLVAYLAFRFAGRRENTQDC